MRVIMDRFRSPDASDEIARCQSCGERFHYTQMDDVGFCPACHTDEETEDEKDH